VGGYVLTCAGEVQESVIVHDDPPMHVVGPIARGPAVSVTIDLALKLRVFQLKSEARILELLLSCPKLLQS
jgi:hypothetical protein